MHSVVSVQFCLSFGAVVVCLFFVECVAHCIRYSDFTNFRIHFTHGFGLLRIFDKYFSFNSRDSFFNPLCILWNAGMFTLTGEARWKKSNAIRTSLRSLIFWKLFKRPACYLYYSNWIRQQYFSRVNFKSSKRFVLNAYVLKKINSFVLWLIVPVLSVISSTATVVLCCERVLLGE